MTYYLNPSKNTLGAYPAPQSTPASGLVALTQAQRDLVVQYNGFVTLSPGENGETIVAADTEAWEAWKEAQAALPPPKPAPTVEELEAKIMALTTSNAMLEDCLVEMAGVVYA